MSSPFLLSLALAAPAMAFEIPGIENDAIAYQSLLQHRFPAGAMPQQRNDWRRLGGDMPKATVAKVARLCLLAI